jgi:hypothetical protein
MTCIDFLTFRADDPYSRHRVTLKLRHGILDPVKAKLEVFLHVARGGSLKTEHDFTHLHAPP